MPAMALDHATNNSQADAGPFELRLMMQSLENPEELVSVFHFETDPVVRHAKDDLPAFAIAGDGHLGFLAGTSELDGV